MYFPVFCCSYCGSYRCCDGEGYEPSVIIYVVYVAQTEINILCDNFSITLKYKRFV